MGGPKSYCRNQFRPDKLTLNHDDPSDFYLMNWLDRSPLPLFFVRLLVFIGCTSILVASIVVTSEYFSLNYWPIYMTHWGLVMITLTSGCGLLVSCVALIKGSIDSETLPWYMKVYWLLYIVSVNIAFFITLFYYVLLFGLFGEQFSMDPVLDVFIHGINSVMMFCLLITARHPLHLLQFIYPIIFAIIYLIFTVIYFFAGGTNPLGDVSIYPMLDWSNPGPTIGMVFATAAFLVVQHVAVHGISSLRDRLFSKNSNKINITD